MEKAVKYNLKKKTNKFLFQKKIVIKKLIDFL